MAESDKSAGPLHVIAELVAAPGLADELRQLASP